MSGPFKPSRREAIAGLVVAFTLAPAAMAQPAKPELSGSLKINPRLDSWLRIDGDGITVFTGKAELGQGIKTALIQIAAEELDVPFAAIRLVTADTARTPDEGMTAGSHSVQDSGAAIRTAAAHARLLLSEAAAVRWKVSAAQVATTGTGRMRGPGGVSLAYGELAQGLAMRVEVRPDPPLREPAAYHTVGKPVPRVDIPAKVSGGAAYVHDLRMPGMLHARVLRGPGEGTRLKPEAIEAAGRSTGVVKLVRNGAFAAVVADNEWNAIQALRAARERGWDPVGPAFATTTAAALEIVRRAPTRDDTILDRNGAAATTAKRVKARYSRPWLSHGSIGPSCAVALFQDGVMTVWTHSQGVYPLRGALAQLLHLAPEKVRCIHAEGSGCYGHNSADDVAGDAALTALAMPGRPIRMQYMREQEHGFEPLGPGQIVEAEAALDAAGRIVGWTHEVWSNGHNGRPGGAGTLLAGPELDPPFPRQPARPIPQPEGGGDRNAIPIYALPNAKVVSRYVATEPYRPSALRSLGAHVNVFAIECLMDEAALAAGQDPVAFRMAHLQDPRARAVVEGCAADFGWGKRPKGGRGHGTGFAFARYKNLAAYCAVALEVEVDRGTGVIAVRRVMAAVDSGTTVNPDGVKNQIEGAMVQGLSWTMLEEARFDAERRTAQDWNSYPIARFRNVPDAVAVRVIDRPGTPFLGAGEAGQGPAAAALANALADATGLRLRDMPLSPARVKAGLGG